MIIKIKRFLPRMLLAFGLAFIFLVSMPSGVLAGWGFGNYSLQGDSSEYRWDSLTNTNTETGWTVVTRTSLPDSPAWSGRVTDPPVIQQKIRYNSKTGEYKEDTCFISAHGLFKDCETWEGTREERGAHKTNETHYFEDHKQSEVVYNGDGSTETTTYDKTGKPISHTVKNADNSSTTQTYGSDGTVASQIDCDKYGICKTTVQSFASKMRQRPGMDRLDVIDAKKAIEAIAQPGEKFIGAKDKLQADVLQQIEGRPRGDFQRAKEKSQTTSVLESIGKKPGEEVGLNPQPSPPKPPSTAETKGGVQLTDKATLGNLPAKEKGTNSLADKIQKSRSEAVGLNPQPLPPDPPPDKLGGKTQFDKKLQTGGVQLFREKVKVQDVTGMQKEKLRLTPRSQSHGQMQLQGQGAAKQKTQTQAVQKFTTKSNHQRWGTSAGSSGPFQAPR